MGPGDASPPSRIARRAARRRQVLRRRRITVAALAVLLVVAAVLVVQHLSGGERAPSASASASASAGGGRHPRHGEAAATTTPTTTTTTLPPTTTTDPGSLPQTDALPTTDPSFSQRMAALWSAVTTGNVQAALPAFFPEAAYVQLKDVSGPQSDYTDRLVAEYEQDVTAAHQLLGAGATGATLVGVDVDQSYAHWVPPGVCYNTIGYYEVPNARMVYREGGQVGSFGIASLISWRGEWYVVHLGSVLRGTGGGEVDDPQVGPGAPAYSSTC